MWHSVSCPDVPKNLLRKTRTYELATQSQHREEAGVTCTKCGRNSCALLTGKGTTRLCTYCDERRSLSIRQSLKLSQLRPCRIERLQYLKVNGTQLEYRWIGPQPAESPTLVF